MNRIFLNALAAAEQAAVCSLRNSLKDLVNVAETILMNRLRLEWHFIKNSIRKSSDRINHPFKLNLGFMHLTYQGGGMFFYSYKKNGSVKTGIFSAKLKFIAPAILVLSFASLMGWGSYVVFNQILGSEVLAAQEGSEDDPVGGLDLRKNTLRLGKLEIKQMEADEKRKDALLGAPNPKILKAVSSKPAQTVTQKIKYRVKPGDTMGTIAKKFRVSVGAIAGSSGLRIIDEIRVGQLLYIPTREGFFYKTRKGDRLGHILQRYKVSLEKFIANNLHINPDLLEVGDDIFLPGAKPRNIIRGWFIPVTSRVITSGYGWRNWPRKSFHKGLDLKAIYAPIRAAKGGVVTFRGYLGGYGRAVVLQHAGQYKTLYAHLSRIYVRKGQRVGMGRVLGRSGNTGYSFGPHLHFEVSKHGKNISPHRILKGLRHARSRRRR